MYKKCGVYKILNIVTNKIYIGSSITITKRFSQHRDDLKNNKHCNKYLQASWNKYGEKSFKFEIIELCEKDVLEVREQFWIDWLKSTDDKFGYNLRKLANNNSGYKFSEEVRANMSKAKKGRVSSPAELLNLQKMADAKKGIPISIETKEKISKKLTGRSLSQQNKNKLSRASFQYMNKSKSNTYAGLLSMGC